MSPLSQAPGEQNGAGPCGKLSHHLLARLEGRCKDSHLCSPPQLVVPGDCAFLKAQEVPGPSPHQSLQEKEGVISVLLQGEPAGR